MSVQQTTLFPWGNPTPSRGECPACKRSPIERWRFNIVVEDSHNRQAHTQLLCGECILKLLRQLVGQSVEPTPQEELNRLPIHTAWEAWPDGEG